MSLLPLRRHAAQSIMSGVTRQYAATPTLEIIAQMSHSSVSQYTAGSARTA